MSRSFVRRRRKLIKTGLQLRLTLAFTAVGALACLFQVVLLNQSLWSLAESTADGTNAAALAGDDWLTLLPGLLASNLLWTLTFLLPMIVSVGILVTHRVAGPVYRFEQYLAQVERGEHQGPCKLRDGDELQELCAQLNATVAALEQRRTQRDAA